MPGPAALSPAWVSHLATLPLPVCKRRNVLPLWVGSFKNLRSLVTSRFRALSGQRAVLRGGLPVGAPSRPTFPRGFPGRLRLASPFRRPLGPTARSLGRRYGTSLGPGLETTGRQLADTRGRLRRGGCTRQGARGARSSARGAFNTMDRSCDQGSPPAGQPAPGASCRSPQRPLLPEYPPDRFQTRLSRDASASLHLAPK